MKQKLFSKQAFQSLLFGLLLLLGTQMSWGQTTIVGWDGSSATATSGTVGNTAVRQFTAVGGPSVTVNSATCTKSFSATGWDAGSGAKYWQAASINTVGFTTLKLTSTSRSSGTGPKDFKVQYNIGLGWVDASLSYAITGTGCIVSVNNAALPAACENQSTLSIRWIMTSNLGSTGTLAAGGTSQLTAISLTGIAPTTYSVTYNSNSATSGTVPTDSNAYSSNASVTTAANSGTLARTGYSFAGWNTAADGSGTTYAVSTASAFSITANTTLYAKWTANNNTITFDANTGSGTAMSNQTIATAASATLTSNTYTKAGYTFAGWNTLADGTGTSYANGASYTMGTASITLYAKWTANNNTITFDANTGSGTAMSNQTIATAASATLTSNTYTKTGYTFAGWSTLADGTGTSYANGASYTMGTASVTLYAKWTANNNTVTFDANTGSGTVMSNQTIATAATAALSSNTYTKAGYSFAGWATTSSGVVAYVNIANYTMGTASVTLYAKWTANNNTITFDANTGSGTMISQIIATAASANLSTNTYTKSGYDFGGWTTAADGTGTAYIDGENYIMGTTDVTLYAKWTSVALASQTITFNALSPLVYSTTPLTLTATASSGLEVSYSSDNINVATVSGSTVTLVGVGSANITASQAGNGSYNGAPSVTQTLTVTPKELTIASASASDKTYDRNTTAVLNGTLSGVINSDAVSLSLSATFNTATAGIGKSVTSTSSIGGTKAGNYTLTQPTGLTANITAITLTVNGATVTSKSYTGTTATTITGASLVGVISPDAVGVTGGGNFAQASVGTGIAVTTSLTLNGVDAGNYSVSQPSGLTGTITTSGLTLNGITGANKVYDATTVATITGTPAYVGLQNGETFSVTGTPMSSFASKTIGTAKPITVSGYTAPNSNYTLTQPAGLTGNITVATLTVNGATAANKVFNGTTATTTSGGTFVGVLSTDVVTVTHGVANFASSAVGTGIAVTSAITASGTDGGNYTVTQPTLTADITAAPVTLATWNFGTASGSAVAASVPTNLTVSTLTQGNSFGTSTLLSTTSPSTTYVGSSGTYNAGIAANVGALNTTTITNAYFEFTVTPSSGYYFSMSSISFGSRSTGTGPANYSLRSSFDSYSSDLVSGALNGTTWTLKSNTSLSSISADATPITYRIYGFGGSGSPGSGSVNWRIDDLNITGLVVLSKTPPTLTPDTSDNTVDNNNEITFTDDATWRTKITALKIGTTVLTPTTDYVITSGTITLKPSGGNALLTAAGSKSITIIATGYTNATVTQVINAGVPTANSTATISNILAPNTTRTITCTALDQYSNYVSGYTFKYTATITNSDATNNETYTIDGSQYSATTTQNVSWNGVTAGITTFDATLPSTIDATDGISIQIKLADGTTTIGSPFAYHELPGQTITFNSLSNVTYGDGTYDISATGGASGNPVVFSSSDTSIATCTGTNGKTITVVGPGTCTIYANQAGNAGYNTAAQVSQPLTVDKKALTITAATALDKVYNGNNVATITGTLSTTTVGSDVVTLILSGTFADINAGSAIAVTSTSTLGGTHAGKYTLTQPTGLTANITQVATNTINGFGTITNKIIGQTFTLAATSTSGLTVTYSSSNENVATISGNTVTSVGVGVTNITASQAGNGNYVAATSLTQELIVTPVPIAAWDFTGVGSNTIASLAATTFDSNLISASGASTITRGASAGWSTAGNSFRTAGFKMNGIATTNTNYFQVTLTPALGQNVSLSTINANFAGTTAFYGTPGVTSQYAYSLDGTNFTLIGLPVTSMSLKPAEIDLSGVAALQGVPSGTTITLRYYASGQTTTGGWGFYSAAAGTNGLSIGGSVAGTPTTTWDGSVWSDGTPTISKNAVIDAAYSTTDYGVFSANTLTVNNGYTFTINSGQNITVRNSITNNGTFVVENNANLIQTNNVANIGNITVKRDSALLLRLDHTLWSSPVTGSQRLKDFSPGTLQNRFYTYATTSNSYVNTPNPTNIDGSNFTNNFTFTAGKGYAIRTANNHSATISTAFSGTFTGVPNNGNVPFTLATDAGSGNNFNLVGNPYPSTIDVAAFLNGNLNVAGTIYFYTHSMTMNAATGLFPQGTNYSSYNSLGSTLSTHINGDLHQDPVVPNGTVQVGQGFFVKSLTGGTVTFTNAMRTGNNVNQFLRTAEIEKHRIWLNLKTDTGTDINQMMVGYTEGATQAVDTDYDGLLFGNTGSSLSSVLNGAYYGIQGRSLPFESNDVVPLAFKASATGNYMISLTNTDGLFAGSQDIFVRDNLIGTDHNIKVSPYTFASDAGTFDSRFELVYTQALGIPSTDFTPNSVIVYKNTDWFHVNTKGITMEDIQVYDVSGRLIYKQADINAPTAVLTGLTKTNEVLFLKITSVDNVTVTVKVIN